MYVHKGKATRIGFTMKDDKKVRVAKSTGESLMITAAFSSNLIYEPSLRRVLFTVRTTTAFTTSPFFTTPLARIQTIIAEKARVAE